MIAKELAESFLKNMNTLFDEVEWEGGVKNLDTFTIADIFDKAEELAKAVIKESK